MNSRNVLRQETLCLAKVKIVMSDVKAKPSKIAATSSAVGITKILVTSLRMMMCRSVSMLVKFTHFWENGAGEIYFVKITYGLLQPDTGKLFWNGEPFINGPQHARNLELVWCFSIFLCLMR